MVQRKIMVEPQTSSLPSCYKSKTSSPDTPSVSSNLRNIRPQPNTRPMVAPYVYPKALNTQRPTNASTATSAQGYPFHQHSRQAIQLSKMHPSTILTSATARLAGAVESRPAVGTNTCVAHVSIARENPVNSSCIDPAIG
jgi:hypothetical protein